MRMNVIFRSATIGAARLVSPNNRRLTAAGECLYGWVGLRERGRARPREPRISEHNLRGQLRDSRISCLPCSEGAKGGVIVQLVESADLVSAVHSPGAYALRPEDRMVQDVEVFASKLQLEAFGEAEGFGKLHVPTPNVRQAIGVLADIAEGPKDGRIVGSIQLRGLKRRRAHPAHTLCRHTRAGIFAVDSAWGD